MDRCTHGMVPAFCALCNDNAPRLTAAQIAARVADLRAGMLSVARQMTADENANRTRARKPRRYFNAPMDWTGAQPALSSKGAPVVFRNLPGIGPAMVFGQLINAVCQYLPAREYAVTGEGTGARGRYAKVNALYSCPACKSKHNRRSHFAECDNPAKEAEFRGAALVPGGVLHNNGGTCERCLADLMQYRYTVDAEREEYDAAAAWLDQHPVGFTLTRENRTILGP